jgi:iron(III) transport system substrate-binding protein
VPAPSSRRGRLAPGLAAGLAALVLTACGNGNGGDEPAAGGASPEGENAGSEQSLTLYSGRNEELVQPILDRFTEDTGIEVDVRYAGTPEIAAQLQEEGEATPADVFLSQDAGALGALSNEGRFAPLPQETLDLVDPRFRAEDGSWVGVSGRARVIVYNPDAIAEDELPSSVLELPDERFRGEIGIAPTNASFQSFVTGLRVVSGEDEARSWLEGVEANEFVAFDNNIAVLDAVERGEVSLGLINHYYWYQRVAEEGPEALRSELLFLEGGDPGALVNVAGVGVLEGTDVPDEAQQLVDYLLGEEAQTYFAEETFEYPLRPGVPAAGDLPPLETPETDLGRLADLEQTARIIAASGLE